MGLKKNYTSLSLRCALEPNSHEKAKIDWHCLKCFNLKDVEKNSMPLKQLTQASLGF